MNDITARQTLFRSPASILAPSSVALVGASERGPWQRAIYRNLRDYGYPGRVFLVNPRQKAVFDEPCFPSLREIPEPVEHAMIIVPAVAVADVLIDADAAGVKSATVYAAAMGPRASNSDSVMGLMAWISNVELDPLLRAKGMEMP